MSNSIKNDREILQMDVQFRPILTDYKIIKNLPPSNQNETFNSEFSNVFMRLIKNLQFFLSNLAEKNINEFDFYNNYNDLIVEIVSNIGEIFSSISNQLFQLKETRTILFNYAAFVLNLAEKSHIKYNHLRNNFNKLIGHFTNLIYKVLNNQSNCFLNQNCLLYELCRALGGLVYENGPVLNNQNIDSIFSFVSRIELQFENFISTEKKNSTKNSDILYKLKLISTQLIFNITIAKVNRNDDTEQIEREFLEDQQKVQCAQFFIKVLRFNLSLNLNLNSNSEKCSYKDDFIRGKNVLDEEFMANITKTMNKALNGLDNLFQAINASHNWIQIKHENFQLGDILAIVKELCLYGLIVRSNKMGELEKENKLEPSNVDDLIQVEKSKISNENESETTKSANLEEENNDLNDTKNEKTRNKKLNNKNSNSGYRENEKGKKSKFNRNSSAKQIQIKNNQSNFSMGKHSENDNHTLQYLKEAQLPLFNFKALVNSLGNDSDASDSSFNGSNFNMEKSKAKVRVTAFGVLLTIFQYSIVVYCNA